MTISIPEESTEIVKEMIKKEKIRLNEKITSLSEQLHEYEQKYQLSSESFLEQFNKGELGDDQVYFDWYANFQTLQRVKERLNSLEKVKLD